MLKCGVKHRVTPHFHCCYCPATVINQAQLLAHIGNHSTPLKSSPVPLPGSSSVLQPGSSSSTSLPDFSSSAGHPLFHAKAVGYPPHNKDVIEVTPSEPDVTPSKPHFTEVTPTQRIHIRIYRESLCRSVSSLLFHSDYEHIYN